VKQYCAIGVFYYVCAGRCAGQWPNRARRQPATEPPQGVLPHCPIGKAPAFLPWRSSQCFRRRLRKSQHIVYRRSEMSTLMKNKSLLLLPIGLAVLIAIGILTS
jgi:hypothetical protein